MQLDRHMTQCILLVHMYHQERMFGISLSDNVQGSEKPHMSRVSRKARTGSAGKSPSWWKPHCKLWTVDHLVDDEMVCVEWSTRHVRRAGYLPRGETFAACRLHRMSCTVRGLQKRRLFGGSAVSILLEFELLTEEVAVGELTKQVKAGIQ